MGLTNVLINQIADGGVTYDACDRVRDILLSVVNGAGGEMSWRYHASCNEALKYVSAKWIDTGIIGETERARADEASGRWVSCALAKWTLEGFNEGLLLRPGKLAVYRSWELTGIMLGDFAAEHGLLDAAAISTLTMAKMAWRIEMAKRGKRGRPEKKKWQGWGKGA